MVPEDIEYKGNEMLTLVQWSLSLSNRKVVKCKPWFNGP